MIATSIENDQESESESQNGVPVPASLSDVNGTKSPSDYHATSSSTDDQAGMSPSDDPIHTPLSDDEFRAELTAVLPHLRAFGRSLSGSRDLADDLVQEAVLKAWAARARFQAGTSIRAWTFIILRNVFLSQMRRTRFRGEWDDGVADRILAAPASQDKQVELSDLNRAMQQLPDTQREALILVGAGGFAYEEAAEICGVAIGTIKSRVARARTALERIIAEGTLPQRQSADLGGEAAMGVILSEVDAISRR